MWVQVLKWLKYIIPLLLLIAAITGFVLLSNTAKELKRVKENYANAVTNDNSVQQTITPNELKKYFSSEFEKLKKYDIKAKNIENIVNVSYVYHDTLLYKDTLVYIYDTVTSARYAPFDISAECWNVKGAVFEDSIHINNISIEDDILISIYKEKRKCLFEKRKVKAIAISDCTGDTLKILRNLKIEK